MLNQGTIIAVIISSFVTSQHASSIKNRDVEEILNILNGQKDHDSDSTSDDSSSNNSIFGQLSSIDVINLIKNAKQEKNARVVQHKREMGIQKYVDDYRDRNTPKIIEQLFQGHDAVYLTHKGHESVKPNKLLDPTSVEENSKQPDFNEYSKIFVILDPTALQKSKNKEAINSLLSRILSLSSSSNENTSQNKRHGYGGLNVKHQLLSRRYRRDSKEGYGKDSLEDDYKPRRPRNGGGGAGAGGRTAIPYIRQRGDIYERDH